MIRAAEKKTSDFIRMAYCMYIARERYIANEVQRYLFQIRFSRSLDSLKLIGCIYYFFLHEMYYIHIFKIYTYINIVAASEKHPTNLQIIGSA